MQPILLIHENELNHFIWSQLAVHLWAHGYRHIFATNILSTSNKNLNEIYNSFQLMLNILKNFVSKIDCVYILSQSLGKDTKEILCKAVNSSHKGLQPNNNTINFSRNINTGNSTTYTTLELLIHYVGDKIS